ncbi:hypothetical protein CAEBREN_26327 [Caenorhabditis brenneri]|uniref:SET domain-containing protein n=1 Tax=Caenorhabditis brenneri TaxID=135651 RepID=G0N8W8_CAEBE|nr:hypothetical protein CAEBREN_26327 [Caenorhabditis brenneri]
MSQNSSFSFKIESDASNARNYHKTDEDLEYSEYDDTFMSPMHLLTKEDFNEQTLKDIVVDNDVLKKLCVTRVSHRVRRLLRHFGNTIGAEEIIFLANEKCKENPCTKIQTLPRHRFNLPNTSGKGWEPIKPFFVNLLFPGLFASRDILEGEFVIAPAPVLLTSPEECGRDRMGRKRNSDSFQIRRKLRILEAKNENGQSTYEPVDKYCSDEEEYSKETAYDKYDICIDLTNSTDELRTIRRNCVPNCVIRYVMLHQRMEVFLTAQRSIKAGEELTIAHDYDSNMSSKVIQCVHPYHPTEPCLYEVSFLH